MGPRSNREPTSSNVPPDDASGIRDGLTTSEAATTLGSPDSMTKLLRTNPRRALVLALTLVLSSACVGVAAGTGLILDPEKQAIIDNATVATAPVPPSTRSYRDPASDVGSTVDIADVKRDVVAALERDREIMRPTGVPPDLRAQLGEIYSLAVLDAVTRRTSNAMIHAAEDPDYPVYAEHRLTVTEWQGVQVPTPVTATAMFLGYESWRDPGSTTFESDPVHQYQIASVKEGGKWKLVDEASFRPR